GRPWRSVSCVEQMPGVRRLVEPDEELLDVPVHAALSHLVGASLHEGVVAALGADQQREAPELARVAAAPRLTSRARQAERGEEPVGDGQDLVRRELRAMEVLHGRAMRDVRTASRGARAARPRSARAAPPATTRPSRAPAWSPGGTR